jgi:hypothetical protein
VHGEDPVEAGGPEHPGHSGPRRNQLDRNRHGSGPPPFRGRHQHAEAGRVHQLDVIEVDDQPGRTGVDDAEQLVPQGGGGTDVQLTRELEHRHVTLTEQLDPEGAGPVDG